MAKIIIRHTLLIVLLNLILKLESRRLKVASPISTILINKPLILFKFTEENTMSIGTILGYVASVAQKGAGYLGRTRIKKDYKTQESNPSPSLFRRETLLDTHSRLLEERVPQNPYENRDFDIVKTYLDLPLHSNPSVDYEIKKRRADF